VLKFQIRGAACESPVFSPLFAHNYSNRMGANWVLLSP
jgi:hypothetical protein